MEITHVRVRKINNDTKLKGIAAITFDNCFIVNDIKIILGNNGIFIAMPSRKDNEGNYRDIAHPITNDFKLIIEDKIIKAYNELENEVV
jgi:stage V sporulation protein G